MKIKLACIISASLKNQYCNCLNNVWNYGDPKGLRLQERRHLRAVTVSMPLIFQENKYKAMKLNKSLKNRFLILCKTAFITKGTISITVPYNYLKHWQKIDFKWKRNFKWESSPRLKQWCKEKPRTLVKGENVGEGVWEEDLRKLPKHTIYTKKPKHTIRIQLALNNLFWNIMLWNVFMSLFHSNIIKIMVFHFPNFIKCNEMITFYVLSSPHLHLYHSSYNHFLNNTLHCCWLLSQLIKFSWF